VTNVLLSWIGNTDLRAATDSEHVGLGPVAQALTARSFDQAYLVTNHPEIEVQPYIAWLRRQTRISPAVLSEPLSGPTNFGEIYEAARRACLKALDARDVHLTFHLSPGTPAMAAVWVILAKTRFPAELIESSREHGVKTVSVPFDISADFIPDLLREQDERLRERSAGESKPAPEFADILHDSRVMRRVVQRARRVAPRNVPVLIEGESGTGKEMLARAVHKASTRRDRAFVAVNCGAIPRDLIESELFGHEKGAFTGAASTRKGHFETANGGTLFLDEIGELPGFAQVKLLRVLQESEVVPVGSSRPTKVDVRIIAATNRTLTEEIAAGRFREDLFYRVAVAVLKVPPLRERGSDLPLLLDRLLEQVNQESSDEPGYTKRKLSVGARTIMLQHQWPGNVRELLNTLRRAAIWSGTTTISAEEAREALLPVASAKTRTVLDKPLGEGLDLRAILKDVAQHYLGRALDETAGNKTRAARMLGLPSYQTLTNWLKRYDFIP
jgi:transcriptional regulator with PAS, ATPase and Fis domain